MVALAYPIRLLLIVLSIVVGRVVVTGHPTPTAQTRQERDTQNFHRPPPVVTSVVASGSTVPDRSPKPDYFMFGLNAFPDSNELKLIPNERLENLLKALTLCMGPRARGMRAVYNRATDPKSNLNWPWEATITTRRLAPATRKITAQKLGQFRIPGIKLPKGSYTALNKELVGQVRFQGYAAFMRAALIFLRRRAYISKYPAEFNGVLLGLLHVEEDSWRGIYEKLVEELCNQVEQQKTNVGHPQLNTEQPQPKANTDHPQAIAEQPQTNANQPQTHGVEDPGEAYDANLIKWQLHRLFLNNCREYHSQYKRLPTRIVPDLELLVQIGRGPCRVAARSSDSKQA
ncbi:hypothetical protein C8R42DRAFT_292474 [Lentinula raphanica]|nr:hypothetical protein C8R42DRAFT_292474 [Lentinula raphanica]